MRYVAFDTETFLIRPGCQTPRLVCATTFDGRQRTLDGAAEGCERVRALLLDPDVTLVGHYVVYDLGVFAAEDESLLPLIFQALQEGRIRCTKIRQMMIDNATGELKFIENEDGELKAQDFSLQRLVYRHTKRYAPKGKSCGDCVGGHQPTCFEPLCLGCCNANALDFEIARAKGEPLPARGCEASFRLRYGLLVDIPVADWPEPARKYCQDDAEDTLDVFMAQERLVQPEGIPGEVRQTQVAWALYLTSTWGMRTDPKAVAALQTELQAEFAELQKVCAAAGLVREDGSKDMKAIYARVTSAFKAVNQSPPLTDGGRVSADRHTLKASGDEALATVAEYTHVGKLLTTYVPILESGTERPIQARYNPILETFRTSCVVQGSLVETVRDVSRAPKGTPIEDVRAGDLVYAYDANKKLVIRCVTWAGQTGFRKVKRLHWRGGRGGGGTRGHVDLTADHRVRLTSGEYKAAGDLQPGDCVMALKRGTSHGYARLWPTGAPEITREHRFIYAQVTGRHPEHVHHDNENKLDNRIENLVGMTTVDHLSLHARNPSDDLRIKRSKTLRRRWQDDREKMLEAQPRGDQKVNFRGFAGKQITDLLWKHQGRPTLVAKELGTDYETLMRYMQAHGVKYLDIARQFTARGDRITPELVKKWRKIEGATVKARLKEIGLGYYRWREVQAQFGHVPNNHVIVMVEDLPDEVPVYDLTVDEVENFIVNEICVHNCASPNLQSPPRKGGVRSCFSPRAGSVFITCDYSTLEMRTLAQVYFDFFGESPLRDALNAGQDVHLALAAEIMGITYEEALKRMKAGDAEMAEARQAAKVADFGFPGGMGAEAFRSFALQSYGTKITAQQSVLLRKAFEARWRMDRYFARCSDLAGGTYAERIIFPRSGQYRGAVLYTAICNGFFQELAALGAKEALWAVSRECYLKNPHGNGPTALYGSRPVLFMHDEIMLERQRDPRSLESRRAASAAGARLSEVMVAEMQKRCPDVNIEAQAVMMPCWYKGAEPQRDDDGLLAPVRPVESVGADGKKKVKWVAMAAEELEAARAA